MKNLAIIATACFGLAYGPSASATTANTDQAYRILNTTQNVQVDVSQTSMLLASHRDGHRSSKKRIYIDSDRHGRGSVTIKGSKGSITFGSGDRPKRHGIHYRDRHRYYDRPRVYEHRDHRPRYYRAKWVWYGSRLEHLDLDECRVKYRGVYHIGHIGRDERCQIRYRGKKLGFDRFKVRY